MRGRNRTARRFLFNTRASYLHLLPPGFLQQFSTPLVKVFSESETKRKKSNDVADGNGTYWFYSLQEYDDWRRSLATPTAGALPIHARHPSEHSVKYYKGLGTNTADEGKVGVGKGGACFGRFIS